MEQGPQAQAASSTFLLSSGGAGGGYCWVAFGAGPIPTENQFPCQTLVACLPPPFGFLLFQRRPGAGHTVCLGIRWQSEGHRLLQVLGFGDRRMQRAVREHDA